MVTVTFKRCVAVLRFPEVPGLSRTIGLRATEVLLLEPTVHGLIFLSANWYEEASFWLEDSKMCYGFPIKMYDYITLNPWPILLWSRSSTTSATGRWPTIKYRPSILFLVCSFLRCFPKFQYFRPRTVQSSYLFELPRKGMGIVLLYSRTL